MVLTKRKYMYEGIIGNTAKYLWVKILGGLVAFAGIELVAFSDENLRAIKALAILVLIDSILGVWTAYRMRRLSSWKMGQPMARKIMLYTMASASVFALAGAFDSIFTWAPTYTLMFFSVSEILSIFEKLSLLGLQLPMRLVSRVNDLFKQMAYGDKAAEKEILEKR